MLNLNRLIRMALYFPQGQGGDIGGKMMMLQTESRSHIWHIPARINGAYRYPFTINF